tara:strand:- start:248 stop:382 length:135 start_codon:yes stop_codon:yes gene_type:complete
LGYLKDSIFGKHAYSALFKCAGCEAKLPKEAELDAAATAAALTR